PILQIKPRSHARQTYIIDLKAVELMPMNGQVTNTLIFPGILLINAHTHQVRHDIGEAVIVIAFYPHDFDLALRIGELANLAKKLPVILGQASEIEIGEDVPEEDQAMKAIFLEYPSGLTCMAGRCPQVQVG